MKYRLIIKFFKSLSSQEKKNQENQDFISENAL
jgi:hypothetical protein